MNLLLRRHGQLVQFRHRQDKHAQVKYDVEGRGHPTLEIDVTTRRNNCAVPTFPCSMNWPALPDRNDFERYQVTNVGGDQGVGAVPETSARKDSEVEEKYGDFGDRQRAEIRKLVPKEDLPDVRMLASKFTMGSTHVGDVCNIVKGDIPDILT